jgi:hypothetical protein
MKSLSALKVIAFSVAAQVGVLVMASGYGPATPSQVGEASEEELARAFELLGNMLGFPEVDSDELKRRVEEVGELRFTESVPIDFMSRDELAEYIGQLFQEEYPPSVADNEERMLRAFGFLDAKEDLRAIREQVLNENVAGFYDERPGAKKLFAISTVSSDQSLNLMNQLILSHELRHALQDQHLDLRAMLGEGTDYDDRRLAALSLLEGDATLLMEMYLGSGAALADGSGGKGMGQEFLEGLFSLGGVGTDGRGIAEMFAGPELRSAPTVVREQLIVPYLEGKQLAVEIYRRGGFRLLNRSLQDPPSSMEQVLHPEKYLDKRDEPIDVNLIEAVGELVESEGRLGEFFIRVLFEGKIGRRDAERAAEGWGGDRYALWRDERGNYRLVWRTVWDSEEDGEEFIEILTRYASLQYGQGVTPSAASGEIAFEGADGSHTTIRRSGREIVLDRTGFE